MTETPDEPVDPKPEVDNPSTPQPNQPAASESSSIAPPDAVTSEPIPASDEGLPEWEPLTPELVEDEAIRGDFVIRWAVVGLALLLGISQIAETRTLVHLKNGRYLLEHGLLPAANDVFSHTANDRKWVNLAWLFDIATAGVFAVAGGIGLSLVQGVITGLAFALLAHTVRPGIRTWWGSICAVLALLTCYLQYTVQPELITLLGISFVLWTLVQAEEQGQSHLLWRIVPAIWLWAQCDPRAWFGWFLLILWTVGERFTRDTIENGAKELLSKVTLVSLLVVAAHPFLWESWLAPVRMYLTDYPALQVAFPLPSATEVGLYPIWSEFLWNPISHRTIAALFLAVATIVTLVLNQSQLRYSHLFAFIGFNGLSFLATHDLAAASFVNCVISTLNAQAWYRRRFGQIYSIDWRELLFSRGGRAVTVMSFFGLAWLILSGRLDGPAGKRTGIGFDSQLATAMNDYQNLAGTLVDDHPFNFSVPQGDLMIWGGLRPFVDSRAGLFHVGGSDSLLTTHQKVRVALRNQQDKSKGPDNASVWKDAFEKYEIRQACPRLNGQNPPPDYISFVALLGSSDFKITQLNASTGVFVRTNSADEKVTNYLREHPFEPVELAFRTQTTSDEDFTREFSKPATTYDNLFSLRRPSVPGGIQAALHYFQLALQMAAAQGSAMSPQPYAAAQLAIRMTNAGLRDEPNSPDGYRTLGLIYGFLGQVESQIISQGRQPIPMMFRYYQAIAALQQAHSLMPDDSGIIRQLIQQYEMTGREDIKLELVIQLKQLRLAKQGSTPLTDEQIQEHERLSEAIARSEETVNAIKSKVDSYLNQGADRLQVANSASKSGGLLIAIKILEEDAIYLAKNPVAKFTLASLLMEAGRGRDAAEIFDSLDGITTDKSFAAWKDPAATSLTTIGNYRRSIGFWSELSKNTAESSLFPTLLTLPFVALNPMSRTDAYPLANISATAQMIQEVRRDGAALQYQIAATQMEAGAVEDAVRSVRKALEISPLSAYRPLFGFYLECLTGEKIAPLVKEPATTEIVDLSELAADQPAKSPENPLAKPETNPEVKPDTTPEAKTETPQESKPEENTNPKPE